MNDSPFSSEANRKKAVALVMALTANTHLSPQRYERELLAQFERGQLTLEQVEAQMDGRVHQLLYHSQETRPLGDAGLHSLLEWSRDYNAAHDITGQLLFSEGRFVQVLEGSQAAVQDLYARIQRDTRHQFVTKVSEGLGPRQFVDWSMEYALVPLSEVEQALLSIQTNWPWENKVTHPRLTVLLAIFT